MKELKETRIQNLLFDHVVEAAKESWSIAIEFQSSGAAYERKCGCRFCMR